MQTESLSFEQLCELFNYTPKNRPLSSREAAEILYRNKYGCLPVLDGDNKLVGIITEADFLRLAIALLHDA